MTCGERNWWSGRVPTFAKGRRMWATRSIRGCVAWFVVQPWGEWRIPSGLRVLDRRKGRMMHGGRKAVFALCFLGCVAVSGWCQGQAAKIVEILFKVEVSVNQDSLKTDRYKQWGEF